MADKMYEIVYADEVEVLMDDDAILENALNQRSSFSNSKEDIRKQSHWLFYSKLDLQDQVERDDFYSKKLRKENSK